MVNEIQNQENTSSFYTGKGNSSKNSESKLKKYGATGTLALLGVVLLISMFFGAKTIIPAQIGNTLREASDVQCANGTIDKEWVFIETLRNGQIPSDTIRKLKEKNVLVGYLDENNTFIESTTGTKIKASGKILDSDNLYDEFQNNINLYGALDYATYSCAAYYYDQSAQEVFSKLGTTRNNYSDENTFNDILNSSISNGSNININSVSLNKKTENSITTYVYEENGTPASSNNLSAESLINSVKNKYSATTKEEATLNTASALNTADTVSKKQRSSLLFLTLMEAIDKMKAGDSDNPQIDDVMTFLTTQSEVSIINPETGEIEILSGSALESPSLYSILTNTKLDPADVKDFSSDRILKTIENKLETKNSQLTNSSINNTVASFDGKRNGTISRFLNSGLTTADSPTINLINNTINSSLINNSANTITGITGGEMLVEGAINVGSMLAAKSGATVGDQSAVLSYNRESSRILALNNKLDAINRSPLDITSKNTFLGKAAFNTFSFFAYGRPLGQTVSADSDNSILSTFGECETLGSINAVGSAHCSEIATFDTSTQYDPYNNQEFQNFINENTYINESGNRVVKENSYLAKFILYSERTAPLGVADSGILYSLKQKKSFIYMIENAALSIELFNNSTPEEKAIATGAAFVNSSNNPYWNQYKYAQRYVSIARTIEILKQYSSDQTAYMNLSGFEGAINPVLAFKNSHNYLANL